MKSENMERMSEAEIRAYFDAAEPMTDEEVEKIYGRIMPRLRRAIRKARIMEFFKGMKERER